MSDIAGEESFKQAKMPAKAKDAKADKSKGDTNTRMESKAAKAMNGPHHVPMVAASHMAAKGKPVDGMAKYAQMGTETRKPVTAPNEMAAAGRSKQRGA